MRKISSFSHFVMLSAVAAAILMASCIKDEVVDVPFIPSESETICFGVASDWGEYEDVTRSSVALNRTGNHKLKSADGTFILPMGVYVEDGIHAVSDMLETRGAKVDSKDAISNFNVWAALTKTDNAVINYFSNVAYEKNTTDNVFYPVNEADEYYWPGSGTLDFTAVANIPSSGFTPTMAGNALASFDYTVPTDATAQPDILVANADDVNGNLGTSVPLNFKHIMTAVNVQVGSISAGTIESITLKGVYNKGTYNVATRKWTVDTSSTENYSVTFAGGGDSFTTTGNQTTGTSINANDATFMFIPQEPGSGAIMEVVFTNANNETETTTASIEGDIWDMAKTVNYRISIDESFTLKVEPTGKKLDAHYIMTTVNVTVKDIPNWQITATANDNAEVTILPYDEVNVLAKEGFWTDKWIENGVEGSSARGSNSYSGTGDITEKPFVVFIPENISDADRQISIILSSTTVGSTATTTKVLLQKFPNWTGDIGWEVVDDDEAGKYGFIWNRKVAYTLKYSYNGWTGIGGNYSKSEMTEYLQGLVTQYNASNFASVVDYRYNGLANRRMYIYLEYNKLNNLSGASSENDGLANTKTLFNIGGSAASMAFENVLATTLKSKGDTSDPLAFHKVIASDAYHTEYGVPAEEGDISDLSGILTYILKKNRYCIEKVDDGETITYHAVFKESDLKWFLPAYNQFPDSSVIDFTPDNSTDKAADYWSSTAADGSENAYRGGDATPISRNTQLAVIAVRVNENGYGAVAVTVDNSEMAGGENGEAQWVN